MPHPFARRWLTFDPQSPTRPRLLRRFVLAVVTMLACAGLLALIAR